MDLSFDRSMIREYFSNYFHVSPQVSYDQHEMTNWFHIWSKAIPAIFVIDALITPCGV